MVGCAFSLLLATVAWSYSLITDSGGYVVTWAPGSIPMQVKLPTSPVYGDGFNQSSSVVAAMNDWNAQLGVVQFAPTQLGPGAYGVGNGVNEIAMDSTIDGEAFGSNTLAVTVSFRSGNERIESDIIFNTAWTWDSYRGNLQAAEDIRRVAIHELGHVLGLNHPDQAGQSVTAIMNSTVSNIAALQTDDITGGQALYGGPGFVPANNNFANATTISLSSGSIQVAGTNVAATAENGEPAHAGETARRSVWWKWTAPADGSVTITTQGSNFDTVLGIYTGASVFSLTPVAANDDAPNSSVRTSSVAFATSNGVTYYIAVDGWDGYFGAILLNLQIAGGGATAPVVTMHPSSSTVLAGGITQFNVAATGNPAPSYQWQRFPVGGGAWSDLSNGPAYSGVTTPTLIVGPATMAMNSDVFRCVVSNSAGSATSGIGILTVQALEAPVISGIADNYAAPGENVSFSTTISGTGLSYQWYRNGVAVSGATTPYFPINGVSVADYGDYFLVASNSLGTAVSRTAQLRWFQEWTLSRHWIDAREVAGSVYFLFADTPRIARYNLATETWLSSWTLPGVPAGFAFTDSHLYLGVGNNVLRYNRDFTGATTFVSGVNPIKALIAAGNYLVTTSYPTDNSSQSTYSSYLLQTGASISTFTKIYGFLYGLAYEPSTGTLFGGSVGKLTLQSNGSFSNYSDGPSLPGYFNGSPRVRNYSVGFPNIMIGESGIAQSVTDLSEVGSFGAFLNDIVSDGNGGYLVLRGIDVIAFDSQYRTTGSVRLSGAFAKLANYQGSVFTFAQPAAAGAVPVVQKTALSQIQPPPRATSVNPVGRQILPTKIVMGVDGMLYVYSKIDGNIFRWSPLTQSYLSSIPISGRSDSLTIDATDKLYFTTAGSQVRAVTAGGGEQPVHTAGQIVWGLQMLDQYLLVSDYAGTTTTNKILSPNGALLSRQNRYQSSEFPWSSVTRRFYQFRDNISPNDLLFTEVSQAGIITASGDSPYNSEVVAKYPIRVSPDGTRIILGSGQIFTGTSLSQVGTLAVTPVDMAWSGNLLHTIRAVSGNTQVESWSQTTFQLERGASFSGTPVRLFALPGDYLVLVTLNGGIPTYSILRPNDLSQTNYQPQVAPAFAAQPTDLAIPIGGNASFTINATGAPSPTLQWQHRLNGSGVWSDLNNAGVYAGVTTPTLSINGATLAMSGDQFRCVATNALGSATSNAATLTVTVPLPTISAQPTGQAVAIGSPINLSVTASSPVAFTYQWRKNGTNIGGATSSTYAIASAQLTDAADYTVVVTNSAGSVTSNAATVVVATTPIINTHPATQAVYAGQPASFTVAATSAAPLSYVWRKNGTPIGGATAATYTIAATQLSDAADYSVVVTNVAGSVTSNDATLTVNIAPPVITVHPANRLITQGATAQFSITATGSPAPTYQWQVLPAGGGSWGNTADGATYGGSQTATLTVSGATAALNNGDQYRCVATNAGGSVTSNAASLSVTVNPAPIAVAAGGTFTSYLRFDGSLFGTGTNTEGQLGDGTTTNRTAPVALATGVAAVAAGTDHQLLLKADGTLWVNGYNTFGALGTNDTASRTTPVQIATGVAGIAAGHRHSLFFKNDGTLWAMGWNSTGQLGDGTTTNRLTPVQVAANVIAVAGGVSHSLFLKSNGTAWAMGDNSLGQLGDGTTTNRLTPVQIATGVAGISAGGYFNFLLKTDGTLWAAGFNGFGQLGDGTTTNRPAPVQVATGVRAMSGGFHHGMYLKTDGTLWSAGYNDFGQIGDGSTTHRSVPYQLATGVTGLGAGRYQGAFIKSDGSLWVVGGNNFGQLGDGTTTNRLTPVQLIAGTVSLPAIVTNLAATELVSSDRVALSWNAAVGATYYEVWRSTTAQSGDAVRIATLLPGTFFEDVTATTGVLYRYWIKSANGAGVTGFGASDTGSYGVILVAPTITVPPASQTVNVGANVTFTVTATGTAPFTYQWRKGGTPIGGATASSYAITGAATSHAGNYDVIVTNGAGSATSAAATLTVNQLAQTITFAAPADRTYTTVPFGLSATASSGLAVSFSIVSGPATLSGSDLTITGVGTVTVRAAQGGNATYAAATSVERSFAVTKAAATVTLGSLASTYDGTAKSATATTNPAGLNVTFTYDGSATPPTDAGSYAVVGTIAEANYEGTASGTLVIAKAAATVTLGSLTTTYDGTAKGATATTSPAGLNVTFAYDGSATAPTDAGSYAVVGTITEANYEGTASGTLVIAKATATVTLGNLAATYNGAAKSATATTNPANLAVAFTYNGSAMAPTNAGSYAVVGTIAEANYQGTASGTLVIAKAVATVTLGNLTPTYDGTAKSATATTNPAGLTVNLSYDGSPTAPTNAGSYAVVGTISDSNHQGSASGTLVIAKAVATVTLGNLTPTYDGTAKSVTATTTPAGLAVDLSYDGSPTAPTNAGSYAVVGTVNEANYQGTANGTLVIAKADQTITFTGPANQPFSTTPITLSATASSGLAVTFTVVSGPATVAGDSLTLTGSGAVTVRATQGGDANRNAAPAIDQTFTVTANFASWRLAKFTAGELLDTNISGPNAVYGLDGLPNLVKYALGLEPKQNIKTGLPFAGVQGSDWVYTYTRPDNIAGVTYTVEFSTDLVNWSTAGVTHGLSASSGGIETWTARHVLANTPNAFFRLKVTQP